ncbi:MAG TPA: hypothetical protein VKR32_18165 [Puia sp.]|nr:hypothetical protein [Puia sp.]
MSCPPCFTLSDILSLAVAIESSQKNTKENDQIYQTYQGLGNNDFEVTRLDTVNGILSGVFSLTMYSGISLNALDSVVITEGRFDLKFADYCHCTTG